MQNLNSYTASWFGPLNEAEDGGKVAGNACSNLSYPFNVPALLSRDNRLSEHNRKPILFRVKYRNN